MTDVMGDWGSPELMAPEVEYTEPESGPVVEAFDPTWPYQFKWVYNGETHQTVIWKTVGGSIDGKPYHRPEFNRIFGRDAHTKSSGEHPDIFGVATHTPATMKMDGTVTAPAEIKTQAYYGSQVPQSVHDEFEKMFPDTVIRNASLVDGGLRRAKLAADSDWGAPQLKMERSVEPIYKWTWNEQDGILIWPVDDDTGHPDHPDKILSDWGRPRHADDVLGWAVDLGSELEMETYSTHQAKPRAVQSVKAELAKLFPDKHIIPPAGIQNVFGGDPSNQLRESAAAWAQEQWGDPSEYPLEAPVSRYAPDMFIGDTPVTSPLLFPELEPLRAFWARKGWFGKAAASQADKEGAMVAVFVPKEVGEKLYQKGGEPVEDMHVTLAYFVDKQADRDDWDEVERIVEQVAAQHYKLTGKVNGFGVFQNDVDILWAAPSVPGLAELRHKVLEAVEDAGFKVSDDYGWTPHITLKYDHKGKLPKLHGPIELEFGGLTFAKGDDHKDFEFTGSFEKETSETGMWIGANVKGLHIDEGEWLPVWSAYQPTWQGAHKFVTDGKEVLIEPETALGQHHDQQHAELRDKFRSFYPEHEGAASGWVIPTTDGMGYGVYSPTGGWAGENEPQIHEIIGALDKHLGKPTHWINEYKDALNGELYQAGDESGTELAK